MKPNDFQVKKKTFVVSLTKPVTINDVASELTVDVSLNNLKGLFTIKPRINFNQVTGDRELDGAMIETVGDLIDEAIQYGLNWRREWEESRTDKGDPDQMKLSFDQSGEDDPDDAAVPSVKGERAGKKKH